MKKITHAILALCLLGWPMTPTMSAPPILRPVPTMQLPQPVPVIQQPQPVPDTPQPQPVQVVPLLRDGTARNGLSRMRFLLADPQPSLGPNTEILLFIHGMDSRAEEADDITKSLFATIATPVPAAPTPPPPNPAPMIAALNQLLQKYRSCILERYETVADVTSRGLPPNASGLVSTFGLQARDTVNCVAGNSCSLAQRTAGFTILQAQASRGDATNFEASLARVIPNDCFACSKHQEMHTKHVHCAMDAGGTQSDLANPGRGPFFEACKLGVDVAALANSALSEIGNVISKASALIAPVSSATGGATIASNRTTVHFNSCPNPAGGCPEACDNPDFFVAGQRTARVPFDLVQGQPTTVYFPAVPPWSTLLLDTPPPAGTQINVPAAQHIGQNEGRLHPLLRAAAAAANPLEDIRLAAIQFAAGDSNSVIWGNAYADLSVTGHNAFAVFRNAPPQDSYCQALSAQPIGALTADQILGGCRTALDRAYRVANFLRAGQRGDTPGSRVAKAKERNALAWIAVSGEDDSPHRPVDVPSSDFPQFDLLVNVAAPFAAGPNKTVAVHTRYTIAQSPLLSRNGKTLVVISLDLPTSGYADNLDYNVISPLVMIGSPAGPAVAQIGDFRASGMTPLLDFVENFVIGFVDTLQQTLPIKGNLKAVMGGSLGGNITFRLGRNPNAPWIPKVVVWSPASIWESLGAGADLTKHTAPRNAWENADRALNSPTPGDRADFFGSWDKAIVPIVVPLAQSDTWTSDFYLCKKSTVAGARLDRQETYDQRFLAWHWRLGAEQLLYSHQNIDPASRLPLYMLNRKPMLLGCGLEDRVPYNDICPATQATAARMTLTPGKALFLGETGHSLDNERRSFWAQQIVQFLGL